MTNEQLTHANWIKEEIRRVVELRNDMHKGHHVHVTVYMHPNHGCVEKPLHMLPDSIVEVLKSALYTYKQDLEKEFEEI